MNSNPKIQELRPCSTSAIFKNTSTVGGTNQTQDRRVISKERHMKTYRYGGESSINNTRSFIIDKTESKIMKSYGSITLSKMDPHAKSVSNMKTYTRLNNIKISQYQSKSSIKDELVIRNYHSLLGHQT